MNKTIYAFVCIHFMTILNASETENKKKISAFMKIAIDTTSELNAQVTRITNSELTCWGALFFPCYAKSYIETDRINVELLNKKADLNLRIVEALQKLER